METAHSYTGTKILVCRFPRCRVSPNRYGSQQELSYADDGGRKLIQKFGTYIWNYMSTCQRSWSSSASLSTSNLAQWIPEFYILRIVHRDTYMCEWPTRCILHVSGWTPHGCMVKYHEGRSESKERFAIGRYLLIIGKKQNMQVLSHTFTSFST